MPPILLLLTCFVLTPLQPQTLENKKHIAIVIAEQEYGTRKTLPAFAAQHLKKDFRVTIILGDEKKRNHIPGLSAIQDADLLILSVRRRTLPTSQLKLIRDFEASGKPMLGIRTSSHAFCLRKKQPAAGLEQWKQFDAEVWGGNYHGHTKNGVTYQVQLPMARQQDVVDSLLKEVNFQSITGHQSMYLTTPLAQTASCLLEGKVKGTQKLHPVAWTNQRANGGKSFYTSLGHPKDFQQPPFQRLLKNAVANLLGQPKPRSALHK